MQLGELRIVGGYADEICFRAQLCGYPAKGGEKLVVGEPLHIGYALGDKELLQTLGRRHAS